MIPDKDRRERASAILKGYIAFISALLFLLLANGDKWPWVWLPSILFALSLPSLIAAELLTYKILIEQEPHITTWVNVWRGLAMLLGLIPSLTGVSIVVWHIQRYAGFGFAGLILFWVVVLFRISKR